MRVLVLGGGYAGLSLVRRLESRLPDDVDLTLVDDTGDHLVRHEVHRVIRRPEVAEFITVPLADLLERTDLVTARVDGVDREDRTVSLADGEALSYDVLAICLGSETADYGIPGVAEHGVPLKSVADAKRIRERFLALDDGERVVVGGAGLSGVQCAGELAALGGETDADGEILLVEQEGTIAPSFPENFQTAVRSALEDCGVTVRTDTTVTEVTGEAVQCADGAALDCGALVWTGGIRGPDAIGGERPAVRADLRLDERTFVLGDAGRVVDADGEAVPASASAAIRQSRPAADNVVRLVRAARGGAPDGFGPRLDGYRFDVPGWIVSVGDDAVAQVGPTVLRGSAARAMKATVGAGHLGSVGAVRQAVELAESEL